MVGMTRPSHQKAAKAGRLVKIVMPILAAGLGLHSTCFAPYSCPPGTASRMPTPYNASGSGLPFLVNP